MRRHVLNTQARSLRVPERAPHDHEYQLVALGMAVVWIACEHGTGDPWERRVSLPPMKSREEFLEMARSAYDLWQVYRPSATLAVIKGGRSQGGDDGRWRGDRRLRLWRTHAPGSVARTK